jgi:DNA-binding winged helix-turn-helix (wHTH) protein/tetratricopeptide (TPR) repeat protein
MSGARVDLAHAADFRLGPLQVSPSTREIVGEDGVREILEPRVMQVFVALARTPGTILGRHDLTDQCWEGRIVSEDAINRVISRLRRVAEGVGRGSFRIETVTKVGYRLLNLQPQPCDNDMPPGRRYSPAHQLPPEVPESGLDRRVWMGGALALLGSAGAAYLMPPHSRLFASAPSGEVTMLLKQANDALWQGTREGQNQAVGLCRRAVALQPDHADGWGALALAYASTAPCRASMEGAAMRARCSEAAQRAMTIEPDDARGHAALALIAPRFGGWQIIERGLRQALRQLPDDPCLLAPLGTTISATGRLNEAVALYEKIAQNPANRTPGLYFYRLMALWTANRLEEADQLIADAAATFPTHFAIWFARFYILLYSGRAAEAIALGEHREGRPTGIPSEEFESILRVARAMETRVPAEVGAVVQEQLARARQAAGYAENAIQFASALGRVDDAFAVANAYYFGRGFDVPEVRFTVEQGTYTPRRERLTFFLFAPSTAAMRADSRFEGLMRDTGLTRYWALSQTRPDYRA